MSDDELLVGKTIASATRMMRIDSSDNEPYDDRAWMRLDFTDGSVAWLWATYGGYTGSSEDEYPVFICASDTKPEGGGWKDDGLLVEAVGE